MLIPYPEVVGLDRIIEDKEVERFADRFRLPAWLGLAGLYGNALTVHATKRMLKRELKSVASSVVFINGKKINFIQKVIRFLPKRWRQNIETMLAAVNQGLNILHGIPNEVALPLAYWKNRKPTVKNRNLNPAQDNCGLIWYAPIVAMKPKLVSQFKTMVEKICKKHGIEPLITLTTLSPLGFDCTVPIVFDKDCPESVNRAKACHQELFEEGCRLGFVPYRIGIDQMEQLRAAAPKFFKFAGQIKKSIDPLAIIAPGRYVK
jgi:hypothetical protein